MYLCAEPKPIAKKIVPIENGYKEMLIVFN